MNHSRNPLSRNSCHSTAYWRHKWKIMGTKPVHNNSKSEKNVIIIINSKLRQKAKTLPTQQGTNVQLLVDHICRFKPMCCFINWKAHLTRFMGLWVESFQMRWFGKMCNVKLIEGPEFCRCLPSDYSKTVAAIGLVVFLVVGVTIR